MSEPGCGKVGFPSVGHVQTIITTDADQAGQAAANQIAARLHRLPDGCLGVATGSSPETTYTHLAAMVHRGGLDLSRIHAVALDEYVGLAAGDERSYAATVARTVTGPLGLDPARVRVPDGTAPDLAAECAVHEVFIREAGGVDVQILGIGGNGHVGFNEPGSNPRQCTHVTPLTASTRRANARFFPSLDEVPDHAITQGLATIARARALVLVALGAHKAQAVHDMLQGPVTTDCPASLLRDHPDLVVVLDEEAASLMR